MKKILTLFTALLLLGSFTVVKATDYKVYINDQTGWSNGRALYCWGTGEHLGSWPGTTTYSSENVGGTDYIVFTLADNVITQHLIFNNANNGKQIDLPTLEARDYYLNVTSSSVTEVGAPSFTFSTGTTIYYDFTAYKSGINVYAPGAPSDWYESSAELITVTLSSDWVISASTNLFKSAASSWNFVTGTTLPTEGQNMIVSTDGSTYTWGTYSGGSTPDPDPTPATVKMHGTFGGSGWADTQNFTVATGNETSSLVIENLAAGSYTFKVVVGSDWRGSGHTFTRANNSSVMASNGNDMTFTADYAGNYTFTWTYATNTLSVTYPDLPAQSVDFSGLGATIEKGSVINFAATSTGVTNPGYRFYVKPAAGIYGDAITSYTFSTVGEFVVKVDALANNAGEPVVSNTANVTVYENYTFTNGTKIYVDFSAMTEGDKGVNWPSVDAANVGGSTWQYDENGAGSVKTVTFTKDVTWSTLYNFINTQKNGWNGLKFKVPAAGENCAVVNAAGNDYTWTTRIPTITLHSNFTNPSWEESAAFVLAGNEETASLTITINQGESYQFGVKVDGDWRANGAAFDRFNNSVVIPAGNTGNCTFVADATGDYTFTWTFATNTLSVEYPEALSVALTGLNASQLVGDEVTVGATSNLTNATFAYELKIDEGDFATLSPNPYTFAAAGTYTFKVTANGDEGEISATKVVTVHEPLTLYFVNKEGWSNLHAYVYYGEGEPKNANWPGATMELTAATTANHGYTVYSIIVAKDLYTTAIFNNGNSGEGNQTGDMTIDNTRPYYYNGAWYATLEECDPIDLTTNFYLAGSFNGWNTTADRFMKASQEATTATVTITISEYSNITMKVMEGSAYCGGATAIDKDNTSVTIAAAGEGDDIAMTPYAAGDYIFTFDLSTRELTVTYPSGDPMPIPQNIYLLGIESWDESDDYKFSVSGDVATLEVENMTALHEYEFKLKYNGAWFGANYDFKYYWCSDVVFSAGADNAKLYTFKAGTYTFTLKISTMELTIGFPPTAATSVSVSQYEYATLYSDKALDVPDEVEAFVVTGHEGIHLTLDPIYRIPANTGVLLHAPQGNYNFYEGDARWIDPVASNYLKGSVDDELIDNSLIHYVLSYNNDFQVGFYWPFGTGATQGVGAFTNNAGKAYLELPDQPASVVARQGFTFVNTTDSTTGLEDVTTDGESVKVLRNGMLLIIRNGQVFNAQGARVQ